VVESMPPENRTMAPLFMGLLYCNSRSLPTRIP
jgi:hypothetical protein